MSSDAALTSRTGITPAEAARYLRVSADFIRDEIRAGRLGAIDTSRQRGRRPRFVILPHHLMEWERSRAAAQAEKPVTERRRNRPVAIDYFPD